MSSISAILTGGRSLWTFLLRLSKLDDSLGKWEDFQTTTLKHILDSDFQINYSLITTSFMHEERCTVIIATFDEKFATDSSLNFVKE